MHEILHEEAKIATDAKNSTCSTRVIGDFKSDNDSSNNDSSSNNNQTPNAKKVVTKRGIDYNDSDDRDSSSNKNKNPRAKKAKKG
jgi:hypothetical protein